MTRDTTPRLVSATEARTHFGQLVEDVKANRAPIYVERSGEQVLVMISPEEYHRLVAQDLDVWDRIDRIRASVSELTQGFGIGDADALIDKGRV